jgi:Zn-dependent peptidase ImmA (M78 family)
MSRNDEEHKRANDWGLALLMPECVFRRKIKEGCTKVKDLAEYFQVPAMAVRHRARNLGLNGHQLRNGYRKIGKTEKSK